MYIGQLKESRPLGQGYFVKNGTKTEIEEWVQESVKNYKCIYMRKSQLLNEIADRIEDLAKKKEQIIQDILLIDNSPAGDVKAESEDH